MKSVLGLVTGAAAGALTAWRSNAKPGQAGFHFVFLSMLIGASVMLSFSLFLPDDTARIVQEFIGWGFAGAMAAMALLAAIKGLEFLLDS